MEYSLWNTQDKLWNRRVNSTSCIARVYTMHPNNSECFFLRLRLHVRGPISFTYLKTVDGILCATFRDACSMHGLLKDDAHWNETSIEAANIGVVKLWSKG
eukprot:GHVR01054560.1.p1 GENE.GHVR01054560.1~~GHVR01054560.1.p1  ORF type:complete len:101 (-),score=4.32 GHVR01054560.1:63-365(-)